MAQKKKLNVLLKWLKVIHIDPSTMTRKFMNPHELHLMFKFDHPTVPLTVGGFIKLLNKICTDDLFVNLKSRTNRINNSERKREYIILRDDELNIDINELKLNIPREKRKHVTEAATLDEQVIPRPLTPPTLKTFHRHNSLSPFSPIEYTAMYQYKSIQLAKKCKRTCTNDTTQSILATPTSVINNTTINNPNTDHIVDTTNAINDVPNIGGTTDLNLIAVDREAYIKSSEDLDFAISPRRHILTEWTVSINLNEKKRAMTSSKCIL